MSQQGQFAGISGDIQTLTGNVGGGVGPTGGNINLVGAGGILVTGNPGTSTLTITGGGGGGTITAVDSGDNINVVTVGTVATVNLDTSILQPNTTADGLSGVYALGVTDYTTDRFMHAYGTQSTFLGYRSGNLTNTSNSSVGIGTQALGNLDASDGNVAIGAFSLANITSSIGFNTAVGQSSLLNLLTGLGNICLGSGSGTAYLTNESSNIIIGNLGVVGEDNTIRIGIDGSGDGQQNRAFIAGIYGVSPLAGSNQVVIMDMDGQLGTDSAGTYATMYVTDDLTATPAAGVLNVVGGDNMNTEAPGSSNTVTIHLDTSISQPDTNASGTEGLYSLGGARFMHNYGINNTFLGADVANLTLTATDSVGIGTSCLAGVTSSSENCAIGVGSQFSLTSGNGGNISVGVESLLLLLTGAYNVALGHNSGNLLVGAESSNILINSLGVAAESNTLRIGASTGVGNQQLNAAYISGIYNKTVGATSGVVMIDSADKLGSSNGANGELLIGGGTGPVWANLASSDGSVTITNGTNSIDLTVPGGGAGGTVYLNALDNENVFSADLVQVPTNTALSLKVRALGIGKILDGVHAGQTISSFSESSFIIQRILGNISNAGGGVVGTNLMVRSFGAGVAVNNAWSIYSAPGSDPTYFKIGVSAYVNTPSLGSIRIYWKLDYSYETYTNPMP
jgi:hypothetical protein